MKRDKIIVREAKIAGIRAIFTLIRRGNDKFWFAKFPDLPKIEVRDPETGQIFLVDPIMTADGLEKFRLEYCNEGEKNH